MARVAGQVSSSILTAAEARWPTNPRKGDNPGMPSVLEYTAPNTVRRAGETRS